jgi:hypothetical protein
LSLVESSKRRMLQSSSSSFCQQSLIVMISVFVIEISSLKTY